MISYLTNCRLYNAPNQTVHIGIEEGKIVELKADITASDTILLDANGKIVTPGLIDTHVHGAGGANPFDGRAESLHIMAQTLCRLGTTSFNPTTFYIKDNDNEHLKIMADTIMLPRESDCLGIHLEGPFINPLRKGGIPVSCLIKPNRETLSDVLMKTRGKLSIMTLAPEIPWNDNVIQICKEFGIVASFGHSDANNEQAKKGFGQGIRMVTHLNNAMRKYDKNNDPPYPAILNSNAYVQMITDGKHLEEKEIRYFYEQMGTDRIVLITDGIESCGLPEGEYMFGNKKYRSENGLAFYSDGSGKIGTSLSLFEIMMRFKKITGCSLAEAIKTSSENPAKCLNIDDHKGFIREGYDADMLIIDENDNLISVIKSGEPIF